MNTDNSALSNLSQLSDRILFMTNLKKNKDYVSLLNESQNIPVYQSFDLKNNQYQYADTFALYQFLPLDTRREIIYQFIVPNIPDNIKKDNVQKMILFFPLRSFVIPFLIEAFVFPDNDDVLFFDACVLPFKFIMNQLHVCDSEIKALLLEDACKKLKCCNMVLEIINQFFISKYEKLVSDVRKHNASVKHCNVCEKSKSQFKNFLYDTPLQEIGGKIVVFLNSLSSCNYVLTEKQMILFRSSKNYTELINTVNDQIKKIKLIHLMDLNPKENRAIESSMFCKVKKNVDQLKVSCKNHNLDCDTFNENLYQNNSSGSYQRTCKNHFDAKSYAQFFASTDNIEQLKRYILYNSFLNDMNTSIKLVELIGEWIIMHSLLYFNFEKVRSTLLVFVTFTNIFYYKNELLHFKISEKSDYQLIQIVDFILTTYQLLFLDELINDNGLDENCSAFPRSIAFLGYLVLFPIKYFCKIFLNDRKKDFYGNQKYKAWKQIKSLDFFSDY